MTVYDAIALLAAGIGGGIAGTMASVASVVSYPALLALGLPPLAANVTNTMSLVFCVPGAVLGGRTELAGQRPRIVRFGAVVAAGGALGAAILLLAPPGAFALAVPVLIGSAAVVVLLQPKLRALSPRPGAEQSKRRLAVMFCVAAYLGYFGAAGGVLLLAALAAGFLIGGYAGQRLVRHLPVAVLRVIVALAGLALAVKLGISAYQ
jgi:uncharacterized protein